MSTRKLIKVMRGIPGSGKSTLAREMVGRALDRGESTKICSADDYFMKNGEYRFVGAEIGEAHKTCMRQYLTALQNLVDFVVVDNTNINIEDIAPYVAIGEALGYDVEVVQVNTPLEVALGRNVHGVGDAQVTSMYKRMLNTRLPFRYKVSNVP